MARLSERSIKVISDLEFQEKYYFKKQDIRKHFSSDKQLYNFLFNQMKNKRIIKLNRDKYFLVPIKARTGRWTDHPIIVADELMDSKNYYIGGMYAAYYWELTEQVPMQIDIYTTRRQGSIYVLNKRFIFHRIRKTAMKKSIKRKIRNHPFNILTKENTIEWLSKK